ncbi:MAG: polysaccharide deacetylase family protein [Gemmatimonadaceae bacterium]|nr:polysaccharide deacetylase family protein [Gemmatimonadaceae bacterium]
MRAILTYHSVDETGSAISVSPAAFRAHCAFFASGRVNVVPLADLPKLRDDQEAVALTFDDGFANFRTEALPVLTEHGLPATVFAVSNHVGGHNDWGRQLAAGIPHLPLMGWNDLGAVASSGVEIGAHTRTHPHLPAVPAAQREAEIAGSADDIEARLGMRPATFAYPYGDVDPGTAAMVRRHFTWGCTTELRAVAAAEDAAQLPRLDAYYLRSSGALEAWGSATFRSWLWLRSSGRKLRTLLERRGSHTREVA